MLALSPDFCFSLLTEKKCNEFIKLDSGTDILSSYVCESGFKNVSLCCVEFLKNNFVNPEFYK